MDWLALIVGLVKLLGAFTSWLHDRQMMSAGQAEQVASELKGQADALSKALAAREAVRSDLARNPGRVSDNDGFKRE